MKEREEMNDNSQENDDNKNIKEKKTWIAIILNFFFLPFGFYYLKNKKNFLIFSVINLFVAIMFLFIIWILLQISLFENNLFSASILLLWLSFHGFIVYQTIKVKNENNISAIKIFSKPHSFWFIPIYLIVFFLLAFLIEPLQKSILEANNIPAGSMQPTLKIGDFLFVNKLKYSLNIGKPERGDIVTFTPTNLENYHNLKNKILVKRIVGMPNENIKIIDDEIYINNKPYKVTLQQDRSVLKDLDIQELEKQNVELFKEKIEVKKNKNHFKEYYILKNRIYIKRPDDLRNPNREWRLRENEYFVMGDNRDNSDDSRNWGVLPLENIQGTAIMTYFSVNWNESHLYGDPVNVSIKILKWIIGNKPNAYVRWSRVGRRLK